MDDPRASYSAVPGYCGHTGFGHDAINRGRGYWQVISLGDVVKRFAVLVVCPLFAAALLLRFVAAARIHEVFTAAALLLVLGSALLMQSIGMSMALGLFWQVCWWLIRIPTSIEADIEPFKGLLGFFYGGRDVRQGLVYRTTATILFIVASLILVKFGDPGCYCQASES